LWCPACLGFNKCVYFTPDDLFSNLIQVTGQLYAWGSNNKGQIGTGSSSNKPVQLRRFVGGDFTVEFKAIAAGKTHSLALTKKGQIYAWGNAKYNGTGNEHYSK